MHYSLYIRLRRRVRTSFVSSCVFHTTAYFCNKIQGCALCVVRQELGVGKRMPFPWDEWVPGALNKRQMLQLLQENFITFDGSEPKVDHSSIDLSLVKRKRRRKRRATGVKTSSSPSFSLSGQITSRETVMALLKRSNLRINNDDNAEAIR